MLAAKIPPRHRAARTARLYRGWIARNRVGGYAAGSVSRKRTASPPDGVVNSPSHITCDAAHERADRPAGDRHAVIGRPAGARGDPAIGDGLAPLEIDHREVGVVADGDAALAGDAEQARRPGAGEIDEARISDSRPALTWSSMIGTSVCTPVMPEGVAG